MQLGKKLNHIFAWLGRVAVPVYAQKRDGLRYNQERIMHGFSAVLVYIGFLVLIPSLYASFDAGLPIVAIIDVMVYVLLLMLCTVRKIPFKWRVNGVLAIFYLLGCGLLIILGPYGAGFIWLFVFPILGGILLGLRSAITTSVINALTLVALGFVISYDVLSEMLISEFVLEGWIAISANFLGLSSFAAITVGSLLSSLEKSILKEKRTKNKLRKERDIMKELKKQAEQSDKLKTAFLANVSHDIRTPMNAILGFTDLMRLKNTSAEKQNQYLDIIKKQGTMLMNLINDIIDVAKIESNELNFQKKRFQLNSYLREIEDFFLAYIKSERIAGIKFLANFYWEDENSSVFMDDGRLWQVLNNLLTNAFKFTDRGEIELGYKPVDEGYLMFYVRDTGMGIKPEAQHVIFERFRQIDPINSKVYGGTGIGLSICKSIIEMQGGKIWVESEEGQGSKFCFTLPYA